VRRTHLQATVSADGAREHRAVRPPRHLRRNRALAAWRSTAIGPHAPRTRRFHRPGSAPFLGRTAVPRKESALHGCQGLSASILTISARPGPWQRRPSHPGRFATAADASREARIEGRPGSGRRTRRRQRARRWHRRGSVIRHASAQPHAVRALAVAMVKPARLAALMPHSRCSCADDTGRRAASVPAVRLASVVLAAHEERRAAPAAPDHHKNLVHAQQRSPPPVHRRPELTGPPSVTSER
jgi:hypothetical protein